MNDKKIKVCEGITAERIKDGIWFDLELDKKDPVMGFRITIEQLKELFGD